MNINTKAKRILVYGDSLPWGLIPGSKTFERFPVDVRWPGQLQKILGNDYEIIEECLSARTLDSDDPRPEFIGKNGSSMIIPILDAHDPLDVIVISLGLNEIKSFFTWTPVEVAEKMKNFIETVRSHKPNFHEVSPRIILMSQPIIQEDTGHWGSIWTGAHNKSIGLAEEYRKLATEMNIDLVDISNSIAPGIDGVHLDEEAHKMVAETVSDFIKNNKL